MKCLECKGIGKVLMCTSCGEPYVADGDEDFEKCCEAPTAGLAETCECCDGSGEVADEEWEEDADEDEDEDDLDDDEGDDDLDDDEEDDDDPDDDDDDDDLDDTDPDTTCLRL